MSSVQHAHDEDLTALDLARHVERYEDALLTEALDANYEGLVAALAYHEAEARAIRERLGSDGATEQREAVVVPLRVAERADPAERWITVPELARGIGRTDGTTRKLLDAGRIPGAERKTPGLNAIPYITSAVSTWV